MIGWKVNIARNPEEISRLTQSEPTTRWRRQLNSADQESQQHSREVKPGTTRND